MIRAVVVDDEKKSREVIKALLHNFCEGVEVVAMAEDIIGAVREIQDQKPDLVFLDISLKEGDSFEILRRLDEISFDIIFVTAFDEYSIKALKYSGMACLFKPLDVDELQQAINNIVNRPTNMKMAYQMVDGMLKSKFTKIPVITSGGLIFADVRDITYIQKTSGGVEIHFRNNESVGSNRELMEFAEVILNKTFCSMGSEYLVNTAHVDIASTSKHKLVFYNAEILNVSENDNSKLMKFISK